MTDTPISDLISRLESAKEPDRELDALIMQACFPDWAKIGSPYLAPQCIGDEPVYWHAPEPYHKRPVPELTASLDAAVALVERVLPGWFWEVNSGALVVMYNPNAHSHFQAVETAATPAIALCLALLKAMER